MTRLHVIDSSIWLEYFANTERAALFLQIIENHTHRLVPVITIYEVYKKLLRERGESVASKAVEIMSIGRVIPIDQALVLEAARHPLPMADSLIYATAITNEATLWTQDVHFQGLPNVHLHHKPGTTPVPPSQ